jgi:hypothetical protein
VPESYSSLANLRFLNISDNMIFGKLPGFLRDNKQLETVDLHSNLFWGDLPEVSAPVAPSYIVSGVSLAVAFYVPPVLIREFFLSFFLYFLFRQS